MNRSKVYLKGSNEATAYPFWIIIDPGQNFKVDVDGIYAVASMITGVWFSREAAESHLKRRSYAFSKNAMVYCHSGNWSEDWVNAIEAATPSKYR